MHSVRDPLGDATCEHHGARPAWLLDRDRVDCYRIDRDVAMRALASCVDGSNPVDGIHAFDHPAKDGIAVFGGVEARMVQ